MINTRSKILSFRPIQIAGLGYKRLSYRGNPFVLKGPLIAIVGSRYPSAMVQQSIGPLIDACLDTHFKIINGLAIGCDRLALDRAIENNTTSVGVLGSGLEAMFSLRAIQAQNKLLSSNGCILSEYDNGLPVSPFRLVKRNKLISGLAHGLIVLQAARKSGTIHTARYAQGLGRPISVLVPPNHQPQYLGGWDLINNGAMILNGKTSVQAFLNRVESTYTDSL